MQIREVTDPHDLALAAFGRIQEAVYFDPHALIPPQWFGRLLTQTGGARRNFFLVAEQDDGTVVGGTIFHYLAEADSGFSSFMGVARSARGQGVARALHNARFEVLDRAAGHTVPGVFIDVVNPTRMSQRDLARERAVGSDPWHRLRVFGHLGFRRVDIRYEQPVGGPGGGPVTILDLLFCPSAAAETVPTALVVATLRAYWSGWLGAAEADRHARELEQRAGGRAQLALLLPADGEVQVPYSAP
jgi:GNAT superfamily N-acetyltransferase